MATIDIRKVHGTTLEDATTKMDALVKRFAAERAELVKDITWDPNGQQASMTGKGFKGRCVVDGSAVTIAIDLSFIARPFKGRIEKELNGHLAATFGP